MKNKKASMTTKQIITLVLLIASFIIILYFIFIMNPKASSKKILCHNSIVERGKVISTSKGWVETPLNCQTEYICYTYTGGCDKHDESYYDKIVKVKTKDELYRQIANEMADCWWSWGLFWEGKIQDVQEGCAICSEIDFDSSINKSLFKLEFGSLQKIKFADFLINNKLPNKDITYAEYLYSIKPEISATNKKGIVLNAITPENIFFDKPQIILTKDSFPPMIINKKEDSFNQCSKILTRI